MVQQSPQALIDERESEASAFTIPIDVRYVAVGGLFAKWTKTAVAGSIVLQYSVNNEDWVDIGAAGDLNADSSYYQEMIQKPYHYLRLNVNVVSGSLSTFKTWWNGKG